MPPLYEQSVSPCFAEETAWLCRHWADRFNLRPMITKERTWDAGQT